MLKKIPLRQFIQWILLHKKLSVVAAVIVLFLVIIFRPRPAAPIETTTIHKSTIEQTVTASGNVDSDSSVNLNFTVSGKLVYLGAKKGDSVTKGQVIASLDQRATQKSLESALSDYAKQLNTFEQTQDDKGVHNIANAPNDTLRRIMENNQYDLNKAVLSVELQDLAKESSVLTSPISGVLIRSDVTTPGVNVSPTTIFTVADPDSLVFKVDVDESDIGKVHLGQAVNVTLDAYPDGVLHIVVSSIDFASHTTSTGGNAYTVEAAMPAGDIDRYRIGMNGDAEVVLAEKHNVLTVPLASIIDDHYVYVKGKKQFEKRNISLGIQNDTDVEVKSGLSEGEQVAVSPSDVEKEQHILRPQS